MGQRHQIYLACIRHKAGSEPRQVVVGIDHQWLYGYTAVVQASRMLKFAAKSLSDEDGLFAPKSLMNYNSQIIDCLKHVYSVIPEDGYFTSSVHGLDEEEPTDPSSYANNEGITVFDFRGDVPKYCFVSLDGIESVVQPERLVPLSGEQYIDSYYPPRELWHTLDKKPAFARTMSEQELQQSYADLEGYKAAIRPFKVMALEDLKQIFPVLFE